MIETRANDINMSMSEDGTQLLTYTSSVIRHYEGIFDR